ncbi:MAG: hypothetical protein MJZ11_02285 [Lachnospiraceae bacterium]|nr:hypothetical protein [Lachnospiraceae bacterium]
MLEIIKEIMPYIVSVLGALIAAISSVMISRKETKGEIEKLIKQHELDLETEREKHKYDLEKQEIEHKHQLELMQKEMENKLGADMMNTLMTEAIKMPEIRQQISQGMKKGRR